jgi:hypothetical protein
VDGEFRGWGVGIGGWGVGIGGSGVGIQREGAEVWRSRGVAGFLAGMKAKATVEEAENALESVSVREWDWGRLVGRDLEGRRGRVSSTQRRGDTEVFVLDCVGCGGGIGWSPSLPLSKKLQRGLWLIASAIENDLPVNLVVDRQSKEWASSIEPALAWIYTQSQLAKPAPKPAITCPQCHAQLRRGTSLASHMGRCPFRPRLIKRRKEPK